MWDRPAAKAAFQKAGEIARGADRRVALTLSDSFCVDRFRGEFIELMRSGTVDTIFANTDEVLSLYQTPDFNEALDNLRAEGVLGIVTRSEKGCIIVKGDETWEVPAFPIAKLVDTTGAGDMFAAGFLAGLARRRDMVTCGRLGVMAAAEIIQHIGARPNVSLAGLAREEFDGLSRALRRKVPQMAHTVERFAFGAGRRQVGDPGAQTPMLIAPISVREGQMALFAEACVIVRLLDVAIPTRAKPSSAGPIEPVFANLRQYEATTHFNGQSTVDLTRCRHRHDCIAHTSRLGKSEPNPTDIQRLNRSDAGCFAASTWSEAETRPLGS